MNIEYVPLAHVMVVAEKKLNKKKTKKIPRKTKSALEISRSMFSQLAK